MDPYLAPNEAFSRVPAAIIPHIPPPNPLEGARGATRVSVNVVRINGDVAINFLLGGTSAQGAFCASDHPQIIDAKLSFDDYRRSVNGADVSGHAREFVERLAEICVQELMLRKVTPQQVKRIGFSVAGPVIYDPASDESRVTTTNTAVSFKSYPIAKEFYSALLRKWPKAKDDEIPSVVVINDGFAAALGEQLHHQGKLFGVERGIAIILGTGVGGAAVENGRVVAHINEIGHVVLKNNETGKFEYKSLEELERLKCFVNGQFVDTPKGYTYLESLVSGPMIAIRFVRSLKGNPQMLRQLAEKAQISEKALKGLIEFEEKDQLKWATKVEDAVIRPINSLIVNAGGECVAEQPALKKLLAAHRAMVTDEIGSALLVLRNTFPGYKLALVSGMATAFGKSPDFLERIHQINSCGSDSIDISFLSPTVREATALAGGICIPAAA